MVRAPVSSVSVHSRVETPAQGWPHAPDLAFHEDAVSDMVGMAAVMGVLPSALGATGVDGVRRRST